MSNTCMFFFSEWTTSIASILSQKMLSFISNQMCFTVETVLFISGAVVHWANNDRNKKSV